MLVFIIVATLVQVALSFSSDYDKAERREEWLEKAKKLVIVTVLVAAGFIGFRNGLIHYFGVREWLSWPLAALAISMVVGLYQAMVEVEKESGFGCAFPVFLVFVATWSFVVVIGDFDH